MYTTSTIAFGISLLATFAYPQEIPQPIDKPILHEDLDYLKDNLLKYMPTVGRNFDQWSDQDWIPQWCLDRSKDENDAFNPADIRTYNIRYDDCESPWVVCVHKDSKMSIDTLADLFGRVPVGSRSYIRHVLSIPNEAGGAANYGNDIKLLQIGDDGLQVLLHEVGHTLDAQAYAEPLYKSDNWKEKTSRDSHVPDRYAATSQREDIAQSHVLATYNLVVPGGFEDREPRWEEVRNQYETVQTVQREQANNILVPGGRCQKRFINSEVVRVPTGKRLLKGRWAPWRRSEKPDVSLAKGLEVLETLDFDSGKCGEDIESQAWGPARKHL
ncbi:MAG: hypothetical protein Q9226_005484 [Calogaya cf. arnoldii]